MKLRAATPDDAPALTRCIIAAYAIYADQGLEIPSVSEGVEEDIHAGSVWVAVENNAILGGAILSLEGAYAQLKNVAVAPQHGGKGVGKALINHAVSAARAVGKPMIRLTTHRDMTHNIALYEHLGWQVSGREGAKVFMSRDLTK